MRGSLALMAGGLVLSFLGLLTCLLLVGVSFTPSSFMIMIIIIITLSRWSECAPSKGFCFFPGSSTTPPLYLLVLEEASTRSRNDPPPSQYHLDHQALHFTVLAEKKDTLRACLALFPVVAGIFFTFLWVADHDSDLGDNHGDNHGQLA